MGMDVEWGPEMFFGSFPKGSAGFSNVFLRAVYVGAFEFVDYPTIL